MEAVINVVLLVEPLDLLLAYLMSTYSTPNMNDYSKSNPSCEYGELGQGGVCDTRGISKTFFLASFIHFSHHSNASYLHESLRILSAHKIV